MQSQSQRQPNEVGKHLLHHMTDNSGPIFGCGTFFHSKYLEKNTYMGVSKNRGTPKWMVKKGKSAEIDDLRYPYFLKHPYV